ncbi:carbohydrate ABC transporter permease [Gryllotalpicola kribbensis]|jgi:multiple sugar transport system permease protein|uniref:carbohydrate ABC transporter permease n=1 Tax=Gryllotalpicola kribbensis TaxID=993084 RepID=UPI0031DBC20A
MTPDAGRPQSARRGQGTSLKTRTRAANTTRVVVAFAAAILVLVPFLWMLSISFTPEDKAFGSISLIPADPTFANFIDVMTETNMLRALLNSAIVAIVVVLANVILATLGGYAFARLPFPGSTAVFYILLSTTAIPVSVTLIPLFLMTRGIPLAGGNDLLGHGGNGLLNSVAGLTIPYLVGAMNVFLARQYFISASPELAEAARVDGAGEWRIFSRIYLPLARPMLAVIAIFAFTGVWDDFLWPLVITTTPENQTVQLALAQFLATGNVQYGPLMAGAVVITIPVLVVFLFNQRGFVGGLTDGSVKG